jgi:phospholipid/cholesterol/gamma-HCH transport system permease protein
MMAERKLKLLHDSDGRTVVQLGGRWQISGGIPPIEPLRAELGARIRFDSDALETWDSSLVVFLTRLRAACQGQGGAMELAGLPDGAQRLLTLAESAPPLLAPPSRLRESWLARLGDWADRALAKTTSYLAFLGETVLALARLALRRARFRRVDLLSELQNASVSAVAIVAIVGVLLGMILAFVATIILRRFGATIYVADVVTIGMVRELGPLMTAIIMAGRTGSSYAAQLGTMQVTDEIEALATMGVSPLEFLVLPRLLALGLMMPLLSIFAAAIGLVAGAAVAISLTGIDFAQYLTETRLSIPLTTFWIGLVKSAGFGVLVAVSGCAEGMRAGKSAAAVGHAATSAVVQSVIWVIAADGVSAVILYFLGL